jgi:hypothetical protein
MIATSHATSGAEQLAEKRLGHLSFLAKRGICFLFKRSKQSRFLGPIRNIGPANDTAETFLQPVKPTLFPEPDGGIKTTPLGLRAGYQRSPLAVV